MVWTYQQQRRQLTLAQLLVIIFSIFLVGGGVSFAALISQQAKLTGNTIQTGTANLQVSGDGTNFADSQVGYAFSNLVPGGQAMPASGYPVYLKNGGGTPLALKLAVSSSLSNPNGADLTKVHVILTPLSGGSVQNFTLDSLVSNFATGGQVILSPGQLMPGTTAQYKLQIQMDVDAVNGPSASINNVDFSFSGSAT